ncbi:MAG: hypothetical protein DHS20C19_10330 [Acidimicrobiales bacterium]|nr:MAG: hypothetical protein DHS20C19_10330 [Acidimicrobiales bacterium]
MPRIIASPASAQAAGDDPCDEEGTDTGGPVLDFLTTGSQGAAAVESVLTALDEDRPGLTNRLGEVRVQDVDDPDRPEPVGADITVALGLGGDDLAGIDDAISVAPRDATSAGEFYVLTDADAATARPLDLVIGAVPQPNATAFADQHPSIEWSAAQSYEELIAAVEDTGPVSSRAGLDGYLQAGSEARSQLVSTIAQAATDDDPCADSDPSRCPNGPCGGSFGHPNLVTLDGLSFAFHGAGDFELVSSTVDDLRIVVRFSRFANMRNVSYNRAIWVGWKGDEVSVGDSGPETSIDRTPFDGEDSPVRVDGEISDVTDMQWSTTGALSARRDGSTYVIELSDGSSITVGTAVAGAFSIELAESRRGSTTGLLGNSNGQMGDDGMTSDGKNVDLHDPEALYGEFGTSWLLDPDDSPFQMPLHPVDDQPIFPQQRLSLSDLRDQDVATPVDDALRICSLAGLEPGAGLEECAFDIALTGDEAWALETASISDLVASGTNVVAATAVAEDEVSIDLPFSVAGGDDGLGVLSDGNAAEDMSFELPRPGLLRITECSVESTRTGLTAYLFSPEYGLLAQEPLKSCDGSPIRLVTPGIYEVRVADGTGFGGRYSLSLDLQDIGPVLASPGVVSLRLSELAPLGDWVVADPAHAYHVRIVNGGGLCATGGLELAARSLDEAATFEPVPLGCGLGQSMVSSGNEPMLFTVRVSEQAARQIGLDHATLVESDGERAVSPGRVEATLVVTPVADMSTNDLDVGFGDQVSIDISADDALRIAAPAGELTVLIESVDCANPLTLESAPVTLAPLDGRAGPVPIAIAPPPPAPPPPLPPALPGDGSNPDPVTPTEPVLVPDIPERLSGVRVGLEPLDGCGVVLRHRIGAEGVLGLRPRAGVDPSAAATVTLEMQ